MERATPKRKMNKVRQSANIAIHPIIFMSDQTKEGAKQKSSKLFIITEYLVNNSKGRAFWSLNEDILKINDSDNQYAVLDIWHANILEDIKCGPYSKKLQYADILIKASRLKKVMANMGKKSSMETFVPNDKEDYYSGITSITVNRKNAYELKGKFLDDLHNNAFSGTNGKDVVEHIEYYLKIIDLIKLPNVDHDKLRIKMGGDEIKVSNDESSDLEKYWSDKEETVKNLDPDLLTKDIMGFKTYEDYKDDWIYEWNENVPWVWREDGYCNGGNLPGAYHIGNSLHYQDLEWYEALEDSELKDEALRLLEKMEEP
ncbi:hypothetical protein Tco_0857295 [Tanacetum coccineum]|uniref:Uncharacterized protein n=1 Tax=Tanacetum coccineum TaxID=301880 RepID=A0ABQ5B6X0_9ASTR